MGLDLAMYKASDTELTDEVLYGRKTWGLYYFFRNRSDTKQLDDEMYLISRKAFEDFAAELHPYDDLMEEILGEEDFDQEEMIDEIYNAISEDIPSSLGEDWDVRAIARWFIKLPEVYKIYDAGDALVMIADY